MCWTLTVYCLVDERRRNHNWSRCGRFKFAFYSRFQSSYGFSTAITTSKTSSTAQSGQLLGEKVEAWLNFAIVSKISSQDAQYQKALFLCTIGQSALEIFNAFQYSEGEDPNNVETIISKFEEYFTGEINKTYERLKFNQQNQEDGEAFDAYLTALRNLAETCNFCLAMGDSLLQDRIVLGIKNEEARKRLLQQ